MTGAILLCTIGLILAAEIAVLYVFTARRLDWLKMVVVPWMENISITLASVNAGVNPGSVFLKELVSAGFTYTPDPVLDPRLIDTAQMVCTMASGTRKYTVPEVEVAVQHQLNVSTAQAGVFVAAAVRSYCPAVYFPPGAVPGTEARERRD